jgi:N-acetylglucosaminyldiphosphoundecaprenol N-acetyl-beta-D-mannosaminyltransferase
LPRVALPSALLHSAAKKARRVFLLGGTTREITDGVAALKQREPALNVVGIGTPPGANWLDRENEKVIHAVRAAQPDILLVSLATPSMESWLTLHYRTLGVPVTISFETRLDALVDGSDERSFRAAGRDAKDFLSLLPALLASDWRGNAAPEQPLRPQEVSFALPEWCHIDTGAQLTRVTLERDAAFWQEVFRRPKHCLLNAVSLRHVDATGLALLLRWRQLLLASGRQLVLLAPSPVLRHALATTRLSALFAFATDLADAARQAEKLGQSIVQRDGTTRSLAWCGEIIAANMDDVWRMTTDHILAFVANNATLVIVDLARLRFIDSAGASLMLRLKKWAQRVRVEIFFAHVQTDVRGVLRLTCIDQLLLEGGQ